MWSDLAAPDYWFARFIFQRALAVVYLVAFVSALNQFRVLLGENGLLPISNFVRATGFRRSPSLFQIRYSDRLFAAVAVVGIVLSVMPVSHEAYEKGETSFLRIVRKDARQAA